MCGATAENCWETAPERKVVLRKHRRSGDPIREWILCDECHGGLEGLQNTALPKPDRVHLLSQVRRATIDDQEALLSWLLGELGLKAGKQNG
jgi:hypothetical protein